MTQFFIFFLILYLRVFFIQTLQTSDDLLPEQYKNLSLDNLRNQNARLLSDKSPQIQAEIENQGKSTNSNQEIQVYSQQPLALLQLNEEEIPGHGHHQYTPDQQEFWIYLLISIFLVIFAGICSGLTVGYLSIEELNLELKIKNGSEQEKRNALKILPILQKHHLLLAALLISNAFAMESLPIFLHGIVPAYVAVLISTIFVVVIGEILPQAYCTGPDQIKIAAKMTPLVKFLILILCWITYPLAWFLDRFLGEHQKTRFEKKDLKTLIELHEFNKDQNASSEKNQGLSKEEIDMIVSTIDLRDIEVIKIMVPIEKVFTINSEERINEDIIRRIKKRGYSKIPVYDKNNRNNFLGVLKAKSLVNALERDYNKTILRSFTLQNPLIVSKDTSLLELFMIFQEQKTTIALVSDESKKQKPGKSATKKADEFFSKKDLIIDSKLNRKCILGLVALKDVFEEMIKKEFIDNDVHMNYASMNQKQQHHKVEQQNNDMTRPLIPKPKK